MTSIEAEPSTSEAPKGPHEPAAPRKQMTKAERRELQEKQRAAKAAGATSKPAQQPKSGQNQASKPTKKDAPAVPAQPSSIMNKKTSAKPEIATAGSSGVDKNMDLEAQRRHQTRIFAHFAVPKKEGGIGVGIKGEIHPAIVRLGRQFADMKIVGANARCLAMLVAFKTVGF